MTQPPHDEFETSLEKAEAWMKEIHQRLKENDNTQGPRSALEARLRETEAICSLEAAGKLLVEKVLMKAEVLLSVSSEEEKHEVQLKLAKIKGSFEETTTYMIHCHSRIEWVWLHWNEYLRARDEFTLWVHNVTLTLEPDVELQLGLKEKRWQYEQALVLMKDVLNQSRLVDRLLEEASSLYNRIGDPSVEESVQSAMMAEYMRIKKKAQERVEHLEKIWKDHEAYEAEVNGFKAWLNGIIEKLKRYVGATSDCTEDRLDILQEISKDVESGNKQLEVLEMKSAEVIRNTSPLGAEKICRELEELRKTLKELKHMNDEEEETLLKTHNSDNAFLLLARQLEANINEFRKATQRLEESLESGERVKSEDELIALWKTLNATKSALAAEEAKAERVKVQLRDLFKFSKDVQPLSDGVISAMRDYQRARSKAFKLSTDTESELKQLFQNPVREFLYWRPIAESVLDATAVPVNDGAMNRDALDNIEKLLGESCTLKDKLTALEKKKAHIYLVLGDQKTQALLQDIAAAERDREALHRDLLDRRNIFQSLTEMRKEFDSALKTLHHKISSIRVKSLKESEPQPDIIGMEAQAQRLQILLEELLPLHSPIQELISLTKSHSPHALRAEQLGSDYLKLQRSLESKIRNNKENIHNHRVFSHNLRDLQHRIMDSHQKMEIQQNGGRNWGDGDIEALSADLAKMEVQRHLVEAQGQTVMDSSSPEGAALIQQEIRQLIDSWKSLQLLYEKMCSLISIMKTDDILQKDKTPTPKRMTMSISQDGQAVHVNSSDDVRASGSPRKEGNQQIGGSTGISQDGQVIHKDSLDDIATSDMSRKEGFSQIGGLFCQDGQVTHKDSPDDKHSRGSSRKEGVRQIGISQDGQVTRMDSPDGKLSRGSSRKKGVRQIGISQDGQDPHNDSPNDEHSRGSSRKEGVRQIGISQDEQDPHNDSPNDEHSRGSSRQEGVRQIGISQDGQDPHNDSPKDEHSRGSSRKEGVRQIGISQDGQVAHKDSLGDISTDSSARKEGFLQVGGSSSISQDGQVIHMDSQDDIGSRGSSRKERVRQIQGPSSFSQDGQIAHNDSVDDISTDNSARKEGFRQVEVSSGVNSIGQDGQVRDIDSLDDVGTSDFLRKEGFNQISDLSRISQDGQVIHMDSPDDIRSRGSSRKERVRQIRGPPSFSQDGQIAQNDSEVDTNTDASARKEGFRQVGGSSSINQDGQVIHVHSLNDVSASGSPREEGFRQIGGSSRQDRQVIHKDSLDDVRTGGTPRKEGFSFSIGQDGQVIHKDSLDDIRTNNSPRKEGFRQIGGSSGQDRQVIHKDSLDDVRTDGTPRKEGFSFSIGQDGQVIHKDSLDDISTNNSPRKEGFRQIGGLSGIGRDRQVLYTNSLDDVRTGGSPKKEGTQQIGGSTGISQDGQVTHVNFLDDISTDTSSRKMAFRLIGGSTGTGQDRQDLYMNSPDDVRTGGSPRREGFGQIGGSTGSRNVISSNTEIPDGRPRYTDPPRVYSSNEKPDRDRRPETRDNNGSYRVSGHGSNSLGISDQHGSKSSLVKRPSGSPSIDRSSYEFRVIYQEDEKSEVPGSSDTDGQSFRGVRNADSTKMSSGRGFNQFGYRGRGSSATQRSRPSHTPVTPVTSNRRPAADGELTDSFIADKNMKKKEKSPNNPGQSRSSQRFVSLAESVGLMDSPNAQGTGSKAQADHMKQLLEFELWLQEENSELNRICATRVSGSDGMKRRESQLQLLQLRVPQGQNLFESLLRSRASMTVPEELKLEELRYLWMLHKSKLRDSEKRVNMKVTDELRGITKAPGGFCSFLHRVCCAALPLQLLLLLLLLLAFLLPLLQETKTCALSNNFARSFNLMLKYDGPPPT